MTSKASPRYPRPPLSLIEPELPPFGVKLYIGGREAVSNLELLRSHGIGTVVNCAVNLDLNLVQEPDPEVAAGSLDWGPGALRYYKLGLVDGPGNAETMMIAGYYLVRGALSQVLPEKPSYRLPERGNILVNCRGGRSRSVALVALLLHHLLPAHYPDLDAALAHVREKRELRPDEWDTAPKPMLVEAARKASDWIARIEHMDPAQRPAPAAPEAAGAR